MTFERSVSYGRPQSAKMIINSAKIWTINNKDNRHVEKIGLGQASS